MLTRATKTPGGATVMLTESPELAKEFGSGMLFMARMTGPGDVREVEVYLTKQNMRELGIKEEAKL